MRRVAALIVIGALAITAVPVAFAQDDDDDDEAVTEYRRPGGYSYYDGSEIASSEYDELVERFGSYGSTPHYDNRTFWERLQSEPGSATVGVSGL